DADHDGCDTRHEVLNAESVTPAQIGARCAVSGQWNSPSDGISVTEPSKLDVDHLVPLAEAWDSGADTWTPAQRRAYANGLDHPDAERSPARPRWARVRTLIAYRRSPTERERHSVRTVSSHHHLTTKTALGSACP